MRGSTAPCASPTRAPRLSVPHQRRRTFLFQVTFGGRFRALRHYRSGKLVELPTRIATGWRTFATSRTNRRGRLAVRYRFTSTTGRVKYRFRARLPKERAYPYERGRSRAKAVVVQGG